MTGSDLPTPNEEAVAALAAELSERMVAMLTGVVRYSYGEMLACQGTLPTQRALERRGLMRDAAFTAAGKALRDHLLRKGERA